VPRVRVDEWVLEISVLLYVKAPSGSHRDGIVSGF
jgi:hypothetical protein